MTLRPASPETIDLSDYIQPGDLISWGQAMSEPVELVSRYLEQRHAFGPTRAFVGLSLTGLLKETYTDAISIVSYGALGATAPLMACGAAELLPIRYSTLPHLIASGALSPDVVFIQISPPGPDGTHSLGWSNDVLHVMIEHARVVLAEVNPAVPWVAMDRPLDEGRIALAVHSERPLPDPPVSKPGDTERAIAAHLAPCIADGATLQYGIGAIPAAILDALRHHRDLGLHSGLVTDEIVDLATCGALTNARKSVLPGVSVGGVAIGSDKLAGFLSDPFTYLSCQTSVTHGAENLSQLDNLVAINSALEVDLRGQVNAEQVGERYLGAIGGQPDFMHAATFAPNGLSVIALPATSGRDGKRSRIVNQLSGPQVTTARSDVDLIVTEHGVADLRGRTLRERAQALIAIAHDTHREGLARDAREHGILK